MEVYVCAGVWRAVHSPASLLFLMHEPCVRGARVSPARAYPHSPPPPFLVGVRSESQPPLDGCFLFTPFPPLFTRGLSPRRPPRRSLSAFSSAFIEHGFGGGEEGRQHRAESNDLDTPSQSSLPEGPVNGIKGTEGGGWVKISLL